MKPLSLRTRMAALFAGVVAAALVLFSGAVILVLSASDEDDAPPGQPSSDANQDVKQVLGAMALLAPLAIGGAAGAGLILARRALGPLREASLRAEAAMRAPLELQLPVTGSGDEWDKLAGTMNLLLGSARESVERVRRFTADAAHELRTPLTTIVGEADLALRRERSAEELRAALEIIHGEGLRLRGLVNRLLELARLDAGAAALQPEPIQLRDVVAAAVERARRSAAGLRREVALTDALAPALVHADVTLVGRALDNLLENALLHGGRNVRVSLAVENEHARVDVEDDGAGIPEALQPILFERFATADPSRSRGGTGLGLALARAYAEAHRGRLEYLGGPGARFRLELPVAR